MARLSGPLVAAVIVLAGPQAASAQTSQAAQTPPAPAAAPRAASSTRIFREAAPAVVLIETRDGMGSGVVVGRDGSIVTNLHVVGEASTVNVIFKPAEDDAAVENLPRHKAVVVRRDEVADLALVRVSDPPPDLRPLTLAEGRPVAIGATVHAIGHPEGDAWTYTRGVVSQVRRDYAWVTQNHLRQRATVIQTQTPINPGSSGGPLLDDRLRVIGINTFTHDGEGLHFAIAAEEVVAFLARAEDRRAERDGPPAGCVETALREWPSETPKGVTRLMDDDCDGKGDYELVVPRNRFAPTQWRFDTDGDGVIDHTILDRGRDGTPDEAFFDTDGDGRPDMRGVYRRGEDEPYRIERLGR